MVISETQKKLLAILADGQFHSGTELADTMRLSRAAIWKQLNDIVKEHSTVTLVYAAKDEEHNNAVVLQKLLL